MEIKVNKEIRDYKEGVAMGMSARQLICSIGAAGIAIGIYFALEPKVGAEIVSWFCVIGAAPLGIAGFLNYHGMPMEKFIVQVVKTEFIKKGLRPYKTDTEFEAEVKMTESQEIGKF